MQTIFRIYIIFYTYIIHFILINFYLSYINTHTHTLFVTFVSCCTFGAECKRFAFRIYLPNITIIFDANMRDENQAATFRAKYIIKIIGPYSHHVYLAKIRLISSYIYNTNNAGDRLIIVAKSR